MSDISLFEDLRSADPAVRYSVLSRIENRPWTPEQVAEFRDLAQAEADPGTRFHMELILRLKDQSGTETADTRIGVADIEAVFQSSPPDFLHLALLLQHLDPVQAPLAVDVLREKRWQDFPDEVLPFVLRLVKKHGSAQDLPAIEALCRHQHPRVLQAAIEALERINPEDLKSFIVPLLVNTSSGIQSLAIRLLHRWDPAAALAHFEAMLFDEDAAIRDTALFHAYFFPFGEIETLMLRFVGLEQDETLLRKASRLFVINPAFATVERLSELYETATGTRKEILRQTILAEVDFLVKSGTVTKSVDEVLKDLRESHRRRKAEILISRCRTLLTEADEDRRRLAITRLLELRQAGFVEAESVLREHRSSESSRTLLQLLSNFAETEPVAPVPASPAAWLSRLVDGDDEAWRAFEIAGWNEKVNLLRSALTPESSAAEAFLRRVLDLPDQALRVAVIETAAGGVPHLLRSHLPGLLQTDQTEVQTAALRAQIALDGAKALPLFETFLFSAHAARRRVAFASLDAFDFAVVRPLFVRALCRETDETNRVMIEAVLQQHPDETLFHEVFACRRAETMPIPALDAVLKRWAEQIVRSGGTQSADPLSLWRAADHLADERRRRDAAASDYSVEQINCLRSGRRSEAPTADLVISAPLSAELADLTRPGVTARFLTLWRMNAAGWPAERREELRRLADQQLDQGLKFHMHLVLARAEASAKTGEPPLVRLNRLLKAQPIDFTAIVVECERLTRRDGRVGLEMLKKAGWWNFPTETLPFILNLLKRFGAPEDGARIEPLCHHDDPRIVMTAVEALERLNPEDLRPMLVPLLSHQDSGVRGAAIRLLAKWDPAEALTHFEAFLFAEEPSEREVALFFAYFFPFGDVESLLLKFLGLESDEGLLKKAGYLFQVNPLPEEPARLIDVWETCSGEKRVLIGRILNGVVTALSASGLIDKTPELILAELQAEYRTRRFRHLIEQCRISLASTDSAHRAEGCRRLQSAVQAGCEDARQVLWEHLGRETDQAIRQSLEAFFAVGATKPQPAPNLAPTDFSPTERAAWLERLDAEEYLRHRKLILQWLEQGTAEEKIPVVAMMARVGAVDDAARLKKQFGDGEPALQAALIDALLKLDVVLLDPLFPKLIAHADNRVRESAMRAFVLRDKRQALMQVEQLAGSARVPDRATAIFALGHFDFLSVVDLAISMLERETDPEHLRQLGVFIKAHLDERLFVRVTALADQASEPRAALMRQIADECGVQLVQQTRGRYADPAAALQWARDRHKAEEFRRRAPPAYALQNIQKIRQQKVAASSETSSELMTSLVETVRGLTSTAGGQMQILGSVVLLVLLWWALSGETVSEPPMKTSSATSTAATVDQSQVEPFDIPEERDIQGVVNNAFSDGILVTPDGMNDKVFIRFFSAPRPFRPGDAFRGRIRIEKRNRTRYEAILLKLF